MVWTSPMTFTDDTVITAAQLNTHLRDNMLETFPAKARQASTFFAVAANNKIVERNPGRDSNQTPSNSSKEEYDDLNNPDASPVIVRTSGPTCLVMWRCQMSPTSAGTRTGFCSIQINRTSIEEDDDGEDGAGDGIEPRDTYAIINESATTNLFSGSAFMMFHNLTGADDEEGGEFEYQFALKYRTSGGDTVAEREISFNRKSLFVWPFS